MRAVNKTRSRLDLAAAVCLLAAIFGLLVLGCCRGLMGDHMGAMTKTTTVVSGSPVQDAVSTGAVAATVSTGAVATTVSAPAPAPAALFMRLGSHPPTPMTVLCMVLLVVVASAFWRLRSPTLLMKARLPWGLNTWRCPESLCRPVSLLQLSIQRC